MEKRWRVGVLGGTGMVGQRFVSLLADHPWFELTVVAASSRSAGRTYEEAVGGRWKMKTPIPEKVKGMKVLDIQEIEAIGKEVDFVFSAVNMSKEEIKNIETQYAKAEIPVVSNNSAHRWTEDVPMIIPEINASHTDIIKDQRKRLGTKKGFICVKPNCSIQSYTPAIAALLEFEPLEIVATTYQAISGAGKTFEDWPEMVDNVIPYIAGEEEKSEEEPLKILGHIENGRFVKAEKPLITTQCIRVPVTDGHTSAVFVRFAKKPTKEEILKRWKEYKGIPQTANLPSAPKQFLHYFEEDNRPQAKLDRDAEGGMAVSLGRLREDKLFDYRFVGLSHNTLRGAAGGAVLCAELLAYQGYFD